MKTTQIPPACTALAAFPLLLGAASISIETAPPVVISTIPVAGATNVNPGLGELRVTYSKPMKDGTWSWSTWSEGTFPEIVGDIRYLEDQRTCVLPVRLEPGRFYATWLNSQKFANFRDGDGRSAVPYLLSFTTASSESVSSRADAPTPDELPGSILFHGRYLHRSRGREIEVPSELWVKQTPDDTLNVLADLPFTGNRQWAAGDPERGVTGYRTWHAASGDGPGSYVDLELDDGKVVMSRRQGGRDQEPREIPVPDGAWFDPNTRPDAYVAANVLLRAFALQPGEEKEFRVFDWDNRGEGFVDYTIKVRHAGKESVQVPAGTFEANHLVLTQLTSADTWFKKRAGHVTEYWLLDNQVILRVLRHREPYEMRLLESDEPLPGVQ